MPFSRRSSRPRDRTVVSLSLLHWQAGSSLLRFLGGPTLSFIPWQVSGSLRLQGCYGAGPAQPTGRSRRQVGRDLSSTPSPRDSRAAARPHLDPTHPHPQLGPSRAPPDSPSAEWQTCCWGCAGAQLHASPSPGGRSSASNRSSSAQLGAGRGLRGMSPQGCD